MVLTHVEFISVLSRTAADSQNVSVVKANQRSLIQTNESSVVRAAEEDEAFVGPRVEASLLRLD